MWEVVKTILGYLNPVNLVKVLTLITGLISAIREILSVAQDKYQKYQNDKKMEAIEGIRKELEAANQIKDDEARINAKAKLVCDLEKSINPDSDCSPDKL